MAICVFSGMDDVHGARGGGKVASTVTKGGE